MEELYETVPLDELIPLIAFSFPEINKGVMKYYLRESAIKFARQTRAIQRTIKIETQGGVAAYILDLPDHYVISEVIEVKLDGCCLDKAKPCDGCNDVGYTYRNKQITLCSAPVCTADLEVRVVALPTRQTCNLDAETIEMWGDVVASGASAIIMKSPDRRWRSLVESRNQEREFRRGVHEAKSHVQRSGVVDKIIHVGEFPKTRAGIRRQAF